MNKLIGVTAVIGFAVMFFVMSVTGNPLQTQATPAGIINLELAADSFTVREIITAWSEPLNYDSIIADAAVKHTYLDFIFIFFYMLLFSLSCKDLSRKFKRNSFLNIAGRILFGLSIVSAFLDAAENIGMLRSLAGNISDQNALFTAAAAASKWFFIILILFYILIGNVAYFFKKRSNFPK